MTEPITSPSKKSRRTPAELRAYHLEQAKLQEGREKADVLKLVSDAHDTLGEAASYEAAKPHAALLGQTQTALKQIIAALTPPPTK